MKEYSIFKIDHKPICIWDFNAEKNNSDFIDSFDSEYFLYQTELFEKELSGENNYKAAISIRNIFHHSLETLFSLFCAVVQSPYCVYGWLSLSRTNDLRNVVQKISDNDKTLFHYFEAETISWQKIAETIFFLHNDLVLKEIDKPSLIRDTTRIWEALADLFLNEYSIDEYNAMKHGLRAKAGGYTINIGPAGTLNKPERHKDWISWGSSKYGSSFYILDKVSTSKMKKNPNYKSKRRYLNWNPEYLVDAIKLITCSISNMISYLKIFNGKDPSEIKYLVADSGVIEKFWKYYNTRSTMSFGINTPDESIVCVTEEDINNSLKSSSS
jgi:hypothetical protein